MSLHPVSSSQRMSASDLFQSTRHRARLAQLIQRLLQRYQPLADFNDLPGVQANGRTYKGLQVIPLAQIAGSVNRKGDFDRQFRPLRKHLRERWVNILLLMQTDSWEPVTLFKVGESYYVEDGHHRVSVASTSGRQYIEADVWEYVAGKPPCQCKMIKIPARQASMPSLSQDCGCD